MIIVGLNIYFKLKKVHTINYNTMFNHTNMSQQYSRKKFSRKVLNLQESLGPVYGILVLIVYTQIPVINAFADLSSKVRCLTFGMSLHLYLYFMYASSEDSGESAIKRRLA